MYRVLIVDDEAYVVDWLSSLLEEWPDLELDVYRAYSAAEALNWMSRAKIDIIITDIQMPDMNGITLVEKVRRNWPQCKVIMLTAHAEFDYAYDAIRNNVVGFILKTEDDERILEEVKKAAGLLDNELKSLELLNEAEEQLKDSMSIFQKEILLSILKGECGEASGLLKQLQNVGIMFSPERAFMLLLGRIENSLTNDNIVERFRQIATVEKVVEHYFENYFQCWAVEYESNKVIWLMQPDAELQPGEDNSIHPDSPGHAGAFAVGMLETIQYSCKEAKGINISFALHSELEGLNEVSGRFQSLDLLMNLHSENKAGFIVSDSGFTNVKNDREGVPGLYTDKNCVSTNMIEKLRNYLDNNRQGEFITELKNICEVLKKFTSWHNNYALEIYYSVAIALNSHITQRNLLEKVAFHIGLNELFRPFAAGTWSGAADYLWRLSEIILDLQKEDEGRLTRNVISFVKSYIDGHCTEDVTLVKLSEVTGYNSSYLSRFFKENTGETLNEYISRKKIDKIKELFSDSSLTINDIAIKAGFDSRSYFNRFIKKVTGLSPQDFRDQIIGE